MASSLGKKIKLIFKAFRALSNDLQYGFVIIFILALVIGVTNFAPIMVDVLTPAKNPERILAKLVASQQFNACQSTLLRTGNLDTSESEDYWIIKHFEESWEKSDNARFASEIEYSDTSDSNRAIEIESACQELEKSKKDFGKLMAVERKKVENEKLQRIEEQNRIEKKRAEELVRIQPTLDKWNKKAISEGSGDLTDYLRAISTAESLVRSGAQYTLTGSSLTIENVSCYGTTLSLWIGGNPGGWWECLIDSLGDSYQLYSIEFSGTSWSGKPDNGSRAGRSLDWNIPKSILEWLRSN